MYIIPFSFFISISCLIQKKFMSCSEKSTDLGSSTESFISYLSSTEMCTRIGPSTEKWTNLVAPREKLKKVVSSEKIILDRSIVKALLRTIDARFSQISEKDVDGDVMYVAKHTLRLMINQGDLLVLPELCPSSNRGLDLDWKGLGVFCNLSDEIWDVGYFMNHELVSSSINVDCHNMRLLRANRINITQLLKRVLKQLQF